MNITAMYFSGTGTTKKVTAAIADELTEIKISREHKSRYKTLAANRGYRFYSTGSPTGNLPVYAG